MAKVCRKMGIGLRHPVPAAIAKSFPRTRWNQLTDLLPVEEVPVDGCVRCAALAGPGRGEPKIWQLVADLSLDKQMLQDALHE